MKKFSLKKFIEDMVNSDLTDNLVVSLHHEWPITCDGKEVINGHIDDIYNILDEWCEEE